MSPIPRRHNLGAISAFKERKSQRDLRHLRAFTVTELLVAVSLMTVIVLALYAMFNQTQKAMRANEAQVDSTERGRGVLELVSREIESARAGLRIDATNFMTAPQDLPTMRQNNFQLGDPTSSQPTRTNVFDDVYYLTRTEKAWRGVGFVVLQSTNINGPNATVENLVAGRPSGGVGTLFRYQTIPNTNDYDFPKPHLSYAFLTNLPAIGSQPASWPGITNFSHVAEGVIHFQVRPYDSKGQLMSYATTNLDSKYRISREASDGSFQSNTGSGHGGSNIESKLRPHATVELQQMAAADPFATIATFRSNALPAYVELELGVLEPDALRTYRQMVKDEIAPDQVRAYLERRVNKVQIFRKRIPFRSVAQ